jgi:hypothetical protein
MRNPPRPRSDGPASSAASSRTAISLWVLVGVVAMGLLLAHTFGWDGVRVDTTSLGLLAVLVLLPLAPRIRKLSAAGVEAEIGPRDATQLQASASQLPAAEPASPAYPPTAPTILELVERDPPLGLARLRMDLEQEVRRLYDSKIGDETGRRPLSLGMMTRRLTQNEILPPEVAAPLDDVLPLANRAVHGEFVPTDVAEEIARIGIRVLEALRSLDA